MVLKLILVIAAVIAIAVIAFIIREALLDVVEIKERYIVNGVECSTLIQARKRSEALWKKGIDADIIVAYDDGEVIKLKASDIWKFKR